MPRERVGAERPLWGTVRLLFRTARPARGTGTARYSWPGRGALPLRSAPPGPAPVPERAGGQPRGRGGRGRCRGRAEPPLSPSLRRSAEPGRLRGRRRRPGRPGPGWRRGRRCPSWRTRCWRLCCSRRRRSRSRGSACPTVSVRLPTVSVRRPTGRVCPRGSGGSFFRGGGASRPTPPGSSRRGTGWPRVETPCDSRRC